MIKRHIPELLAPAGSLDAVRAAVANGADSVYLGAERFNARDEGAQLTIEEVAQACTLAHGRGARIYLTLNTLVKPSELGDALTLLGDAIDAGVDAAIVQDLGLVRLIQRVYPGFEIHGSTQMTVHDASGARLMQQMGIERVVLARENTLDDVRAIRSAVPDLGLETFVHGALCISYSGQCLMSGMISERSANRGSCAQSCRKDYVMTDATTGEELDRGFLISAKDLAAHDHLAALADAGVGCLKVEGRKKKPEYVATVINGYRTFLDRVAEGDDAPPSFEEVRPLVQIFSRGFTPGMLAGERTGREYITHAQPDNRGHELGTVIAQQGAELIVDVSHPIAVGDGLGFEPPKGETGVPTGFSVGSVRTLHTRNGTTRQAVTARAHVPAGWRVVRSAEARLLEGARASYAALAGPVRGRKTGITVRVFGAAGAPLKAVWRAGDEEVVVRSEIALAPASVRALDTEQLRKQFGRLGETPFALGDIDIAGLTAGLFIPVSELNRMRQSATDALLERNDWVRTAMLGERQATIAVAIADVPARAALQSPSPFVLAADVFRVEDARAAADAGATEISFDPFLRHPVPPLSRVKALSEEMAERGVLLRLRTPSIVRPEERRGIDKWLDAGLPLLSGHAGLVAEFSSGGRDVVADYAINVFNAHTAAEFFARGTRRLVASVEVTVAELSEIAAPWRGAGFDVLLYGRPEGMTIEHCVLSAAFDRVATTCRDLCVQKHPVVEITDPAGYTFPVATDSACRNRLLHSRPIEGSEYLPSLWNAGIRGFRLLFNVAGDPVGELVSGYRKALDSLAKGRAPDLASVRATVGSGFTRGHFARAV